MQRAFDLLCVAGQAFGMRPFGLYATESMRLDAGYRPWKADLVTEFNPYESALDRFVRPDKDFVGKAALAKRHKARPRRGFVTLQIDGRDAPAHPGDSIALGGRVVGTVTSAAYGHRVSKNLAMGFVRPDCAAQGMALGVEIIGRVHAARVVAECQYDSSNHRVQA